MPSGQSPEVIIRTRFACSYAQALPQGIIPILAPCLSGRQARPLNVKAKLFHFSRSTSLIIKDFYENFDFLKKSKSRAELDSTRGL